MLSFLNGGINSKNAKAGQIIAIDPNEPITPKSTGSYSLMWLVYDIGTVVLTNWFSFLRPSVLLLLWRLGDSSDLKFFNKELKILRSNAEEI